MGPPQADLPVTTSIDATGKLRLPMPPQALFISLFAIRHSPFRRRRHASAALRFAEAWLPHGFPVFD